MLTRASALLVLLAASLYGQPVFDAPVASVVVAGSPLPVIYATFAISDTSSALFRSADEGATWAPVYLTGPGLPQPVIRGLAVNPTHPAVLAWATDVAHGSLWRSVDGGATWVSSARGLPSGEELQSILVIPARPFTLYCHTSTHVYKSTDEGRSWSLQSTLPAAPLTFSINPASPTVMYLTAAGGAIYRTDDEGATWQRSGAIPLSHGNTTNSIHDVVSDPGNPARVYATVRGPWMWADYGSGPEYMAGLQQSSDGGATWSNIAPETEPYYVYVDPAGRPYLYYTYPESAQVCKKLSLSAPWNCVALVPGTGLVRLWIRDAEPDVLYAAAPNGVHKSVDGGSTWAHLSGWVRPTLAQSLDPLNLTLARGTQGNRSFDVQALENPKWVLPFTASSPDSWISLRVSGSATPASVTVTVNADGLAPGSYTGAIHLSAPTANNPSLDLPVQLSVIASAGAPAYNLSVLAGTGTAGFAGDGGPASTALLSEPAALALDSTGDLYIADSDNHRIRKVSSAGVITTVAGTGSFGFSGDNGPAVAAQIWRPEGVAARAGTVYLSDSFNDRVRAITPAGIINTIPHGDSLGWPRGLVLDSSGNLFAADFSRDRVVRFAPSGAVVTVLDHGLNSPGGLAIDAMGALFIADTGSHRVLKLQRDGSLSVVAGTGRPGFDGDGGLATAASLSGPRAAAIAPDGRLYIADTGNHRIRAVDPQGRIYTIAGTGNPGSAGGAGPAAGVQLNTPTDLIVDAAGAICVADKNNHRIVKLVLQPGSGPRITQGGVVNAASYTGSLAPGSLFSIFGSELAKATAGVQTMPWPETLAGASVSVNGRAAPLYYVSPSQINAQIPYEIPAGEVEVAASDGESSSAPAPATISAAAPGIFQSSPGWALAQNADGSGNGPLNPAAPGSVVVVYLTGQGLLDNAVATGGPAPSQPLSSPLLPFSATLGGEPAEVLFLGMTPGLIGVAQANVRIPQLPDGGQPLVLTVGQSRSAAALISVALPPQ